MAVSKVDAANQIENQLPQANIAGNVNFRNIIINGDMSLAQRRTLWEDFGNNDSGYVTVDRWKFVEAGTPTFECDISQSTTVPTGQGFTKSTKIDVTIADTTLASDDLMIVRQSFEGQNLQYLKYGTSNAQQLTCSFWVRSNKTGTYICNLEDSDNTKDVSQSYTINTADTWEKKTVTFPANTSDTLDNDNNRSIDLVFFIAAGSNYTSGTLNTTWNTTVSANRAVGQVNLFDNADNEWLITGVQLEAGTTASDFEFLPHDVNLERCYRYYQKWDSLGQLYFLIGHVWNTTLCQYAKTFYPNFRAHPSIEYAGTLSNLSKNSAVNLSGLTIDSAASNQGQGRAGKINGNMSSSSFTSGNSCALLINSDGAYIALDAEL